jgi:ABC-type lipopolysaccharide export system ATPase subunit
MQKSKDFTLFVHQEFGRLGALGVKTCVFFVSVLIEEFRLHSVACPYTEPLAVSPIEKIVEILTTFNIKVIISEFSISGFIKILIYFFI